MATVRQRKALWTPKPLPNQREILDDDSRFKMAACGRRFGKTCAGLLAGLTGHGSRKQFRGVKQGGKIWWVAPSYPQIVASGIWETAKRCSQGVARDVSELEKTIYYPNGGEFSIHSAVNRTSIVGAGLDGLVIDEAAYVDQDVWHEALRPALADKMGWSLHITTPNGHNWWHDEFQESAQRANRATWQRPSIDNPIITPDEMEEIRILIGDRSFAQEHLAEFVQMAGAEWGPEKFDQIWPDYWPDAFEGGVIAVDPSRGKDPEKGDYSAVIFVGLSGGCYWVDAKIERVPVDGIVENVCEFIKLYNPLAIGIEEAMNQDLVFFPAVQKRFRELYHGGPLPFWDIVPDGPKERRIFRLTPYINRKQFRFRPGQIGTKRLLEQLQGFPLRSVHDDGPDALEMALRLIQTIVLEFEGATDEVEEWAT